MPQKAQFLLQLAQAAARGASLSVYRSLAVDVLCWAMPGLKLTHVSSPFVFLLRSRD